MNNAFALYHPAVAFCFLAGAIVCSMAVTHPVYAVMSVVGAFACSVVTRGFAPTVRALAWIVPLWAIVACANPLFSASGSTELFRIGVRAVYLESLVYGMCVGGMLVSVFYWFMSYAECMSSDRTMALFGNIAPVITLMVSQVLRLSSQFIVRGRAIADVQDAVSAAAPRTRREQAKGRLRIVSVLMGWGMEDGIDRSDAMRSRGYGCPGRRTTYKRYRVRRSDAALLAAIGGLAALNLALELVAGSQFAFYPTLSTPVLWWGYAAYALFLAIPVFIHIREWLRWR